MTNPTAQPPVQGSRQNNRKGTNRKQTLSTAFTPFMLDQPTLGLSGYRY